MVGQMDSGTYVIRSFLSLPFFKPPKAILVPGMYFLGFSRYSYYCTISHWSRIISFVKTHKSVLRPGDTFLFVGIGVGEAFDLASLTTEQAVQVWADLVAFTFLQVVALGASRFEETSTLLGVT